MLFPSHAVVSMLLVNTAIGVDINFAPGSGSVCQALHWEVTLFLPWLCTMSTWETSNCGWPTYTLGSCAVNTDHVPGVEVK